MPALGHAPDAHRQPRRCALGLALCALLSAWGLAPVSARADEVPQDKLIQQGADPRTQAMLLYREGRAKFDADDFKGAAETFSRALSLDADPILAYNTARAYERGQDFEKASEFYRRTLAMNPPEEVAKRCDQALVQIDEVLRERKAAQEAKARAVTVLRVRTNRPGELFIDDTLVGVAPGEFEVAPGKHTLELRLPNYPTQRRNLTAAPRATQDVIFALEDTEGDDTAAGWWGLSLMASGVLAGAAALELDARGDDTLALSSGGAALTMGLAGVGLFAYDLITRPGSTETDAPSATSPPLTRVPNASPSAPLLPQRDASAATVPLF